MEVDYSTGVPWNEGRAWDSLGCAIFEIRTDKLSPVSSLLQFWSQILLMRQGEKNESGKMTIALVKQERLKHHFSLFILSFPLHVRTLYIAFLYRSYNRKTKQKKTKTCLWTYYTSGSLPPDSAYKYKTQIWTASEQHSVILKGYLEIWHVHLWQIVSCYPISSPSTSFP